MRVEQHSSDDIAKIQVDKNHEEKNGGFTIHDLV
jgi:hypothetical protein